MEYAEKGNNMRTYMAKKEKVERRWFVVDASNEILGHMAVEVSKILMGKNKPEYTPHVDTGDFVIVINAAKVRLTGRKREQKVYRHHTGWPGGLVERKLGDMLDKKPGEVIELAVRRMLPKTKLGRKMIKKLKVYPGSEHTHEAQMPERISFGTAEK
jgi:large subunit ribosomal protein L13